MGKRALIEEVRGALTRAGIEAQVKSESLSSMTAGGFRRSGYRVSASIEAALTPTQLRALHEAVDGSLRLHESYCPMSGRLTGIWTEG